MAKVTFLQSESCFLVNEKVLGEVMNCLLFACLFVFLFQCVVIIFKNHKLMTSITCMSCLLQIASVLWWFYFSKLVELFDTVSTSDPSFNQSVSKFLLHSHVCVDVFFPHTQKTKCSPVKVKDLVQECNVMNLCSLLHPRVLDP